MKEQNIKTSKFIRVMNLLAGFSLVLGTLFITSCEDETLPGVGSIADLTPPKAGFSYSPDPTDQLKVVFTNQSESATDFVWDFGDGNTSDEENPSNTYADFGEYTVTMMATDKLGVVADTTIEIEVVQGPYQPFILEFGFEDLSLPDGTGDGRDSWRNSDLGGVIQITSDPVRTGEQAAKLTGSASDQRIGYQAVVVEAESNYDLNFYYTMLDDQAGWLTVSVLSGPVTTHDEALAATLGSITVNDQSDPDLYEAATVSFNSGTSTEVYVYFFNGGSVETRLDDFSIDIAPEGAVPPSASFSPEQSESDYLSYTFTNGSVNAASYEWDFGDGNTSTEESPTHVYAEADEYTVKLIATNDDGLSAEYEAVINIQAPVTADFTYEVDPDDYATYNFTDESEDAVSLLWEFGDGFQFTGMNPSHTYAEDGSYTVTLTATSITGLTSEATAEIAISAGAIIPIIVNGDFDDSSSGWKPGDCTGCSTSAFNGSSDGSWYDYAGVLGTSKTPGAKYTSSTSAGEYKSADTRYAYQALEVTPNTVYILEYEYAIKDDAATDPAGGRRVVAEILDGHFDDGADAAAQSEANGTLVTSIGTIAEGKFSDTVGTKVTVEFTSNNSGEIAIWLWAVTPVDAWFDNIKVYPKD